MPLSYKKKAVEYTFKNSSSEKAFTIVLNPHNLTVQSPGKEETIPYECVNMVKLSKNGDHLYRIRISFDVHSPIVVTNKYYLPSGEFEDRSRQYGAFVRTLHHYLKTRSAPVYTSGKSFTLLLVWSILSAFVACLVSFISEYFGLSLMNPFLQALILTVLIVVLIFAVNRGRLPKEYSPEEIPLQFLP